MELSVPAVIFSLPDGKRTEVNLRNVYPPDAEYIKDNEIKVSLEELRNGVIAMYFDDGTLDEEGEPLEILVLDLDRSCEDTIADGVEQLKKRKENGKDKQ